MLTQFSVYCNCRFVIHCVPWATKFHHLDYNTRTIISAIKKTSYTLQTELLQVSINFKTSKLLNQEREYLLPFSSLNLFPPIQHLLCLHQFSEHSYRTEKIFDRELINKNTSWITRITEIYIIYHQYLWILILAKFTICSSRCSEKVHEYNTTTIIMKRPHLQWKRSHLGICYCENQLIPPQETSCIQPPISSKLPDHHSEYIDHKRIKIS